MAVNKGSFAQTTNQWLSGHCLTVPIPFRSNGYYYDQTDLTGLSDGDVLVSGVAWPYPVSLAVTAIDNAAANLSIDITTVGRDHLGYDRTETLTGIGDVAGVNLPSVQGTTPWSYIESITLDSITGNDDALDQLQLGVWGCDTSVTAQTEIITVGLPGGVESSSDIVTVTASGTEQKAKWSFDYDAKTATILLASAYNTNSSIMWFGLDARARRW